MSDLKVHLNGELVPSTEARVSVWDAGFLHGASSFTTMRAHNGVVFRLAEHVERLLETVKVLGMRSKGTGEGLAAATRDVVAANGLVEARVRITLTPGSVQGGDPTVLITAAPLPEYPPHWYAKGISVVLSSFRQGSDDLTFGHKSGCYLPRVSAFQEACSKGADEAIWCTPDERLAEACFCNVFLVMGGKMVTPPRQTPVLPGIVRGAVLELCENLGIEADDQSPVTLRDMLNAEEIFLTSSCSGIRPVAMVERRQVPPPCPGEVTKRLSAGYDELLARECSG